MQRDDPPTSPPTPPPTPPSPNLPSLHPHHAPSQTLKKDLAGAIIDPQTTGFCLEQILTTTFVNSMDGTSLAFIMPVIIRGLRDPTYDLVKKAVTCAGNMCVQPGPNPNPNPNPSPSPGPISSPSPGPISNPHPNPHP